MQTKLSFILLPLMIIFTFSTCFAETGTPAKLQWYISNGKDVVGMTNDATKSKQADSYDYTPYGRRTTLSSVAGSPWSVVGRSGQQNEILQSNNFSSKIQPCRDEAVSGVGPCRADLSRRSSELRMQAEVLNEGGNLTFNINTNPFQYSGYYLDSLSGLYYLNARYYSPELMRFISRDSYDLSNRYAYCDEDPVSRTDPGGHLSGLSETLINIGAGALASALTLCIPVTGAFTAFCLETAAGAIGGAAGEATQQAAQGQHLNMGAIGLQAGAGALAGMVFGGIRGCRIGAASKVATEEAMPAEVELADLSNASRWRVVSSDENRLLFSSKDRTFFYEAYSEPGKTEEMARLLSGLEAYKNSGFQPGSVTLEEAHPMFQFVKENAKFQLGQTGPVRILQYPEVTGAGKVNQREIIDLFVRLDKNNVILGPVFSRHEGYAIFNNAAVSIDSENIHFPAETMKKRADWSNYRDWVFRQPV